jgi:arylformamidase
MIEGGKRLHELPLELWTGKATVFEVLKTRSIGPAELARFDWKGVERVLFKTENSNHWQDGKFYEDFVYLDPEGAQFLVQQGVRLVGIDYLSIDKYKSQSHATHFVLLKKDIPIIEGLNLSVVAPGEYTLVALPMNILDADGAPARVFLMN